MIAKKDIIKPTHNELWHHPTKFVVAFHYDRLDVPLRYFSGSEQIAIRVNGVAVFLR